MGLQAAKKSGEVEGVDLGHARIVQIKADIDAVLREASPEDYEGVTGVAYVVVSVMEAEDGMSLGILTLNDSDVGSFKHLSEEAGVAAFDSIPRQDMSTACMQDGVYQAASEGIKKAQMFEYVRKLK